jgi:hypothetical protein
MRRSGWLTNALLGFLILVALGDILIHSQAVHAQTSPKLYIDTVMNSPNIKDRRVAIQGTQVVAFSCAGDYCNVLSK